MNPYCVTNHYNFVERIIVKKRNEMLNLIISKIETIKINNLLDVGTTSDAEYESSNSITTNIKDLKEYKSLAIQDIENNFFHIKYKRSITENFTNEDIEKMSADLVISTATIEHVGSEDNQIKMIENCSKLSKKIFVITTPNRFYPIEFHTKIPFIHWLPKKLHRILLKMIGLKEFSEESNLNLLSESDIINIFKKFDKKIKFSIHKIKLFGITSNYVIVAKNYHVK